MAPSSGVRYPHLFPLVERVADLPDEERKRWIRKDRWIGYPGAIDVLARLSELMNWPPKQRMPNLLLVGPTNNGKSKIIKRFFEITQPFAQPTDGFIRPVVAVEMPPDPGLKRLYEAILRTLQVPHRSFNRHADCGVAVLDMLRQQQVRLLIIDEIHNLLATTPRQQRQILNQLKYIGNQLQIPLVGVGTEDAWDALRNDAQLANRFEPLPLPRWTLGPDILALLVSFGQLLPLRRPSHLADVRIAELVLSRTDGTIGEISALLEAAVMQAIDDETECLTLQGIAAATYQSPSERRLQFAAGIR